MPPTATPVQPTSTVEKIEYIGTRPNSALYYLHYDPVTQNIIFIGNANHEIDVWGYNVASNKLVRLADRPAGVIDATAYDTVAQGIIAYDDRFGKVYFYDPAQNSWSSLADAQAYGGEYAQSPAAYDSKSGRMIVVGGSWDVGNTTAYDTATGKWNNLKPDPGVPFIWGGCMAYDSESDRLIIWDGAVMKQVRIFDTNANRWEKVSYEEGPKIPARFEACVYVPDLDRIYFYSLNIFYAYDTNTNRWEKAKGTLVPGELVNHSMAYDPETKRIVMYGGSNEALTRVSDKLWIYDPVTGIWTQIDLTAAIQ